MGRARVTEEHKAEMTKARNTRYYEKNRERIMEVNREHAFQYYHTHQEVMNEKNKKRYREKTTEFKLMKAIIEEQLELERAVMEELNAD